MTQPLDLAGHRLVALSRASLAALRAALLRDAGPAAAAYLQEAGYAGGETIFGSFCDWLRDRGGGEPAELGVEEFERRASEYFRDAGWGSLRIGSLAEAVATLDSEDWGEADPLSRLDHPGCHFSTGMFADFFGRVADVPLAVLEVECRSMGSRRCRFLLGNTEIMNHIYEQMGTGVGYEDAVEGIG
jgi:predicted hydrocarbon binding protein